MSRIESALSGSVSARRSASRRMGVDTESPQEKAKIPIKRMVMMKRSFFMFLRSGRMNTHETTAKIGEKIITSRERERKNKIRGYFPKIDLMMIFPILRSSPAFVVGIPVLRANCCFA